MQTIETDKTVVNVLVWPSDRPWTGRYATSGTVEDGRCTLVLTERVFRDPKRANAAYRRFARRMERAGGKREHMPGDHLYRYLLL